MMDILRIPMVKIDEVDPEEYTRRILVDSQPDHSRILGSWSYDAIIDHHPRKKKWDARYVDIRPEYGACSTILVEYLRGAGIRPAMKLATALLYGIKVDTANFERDATAEDVRQFWHIFPYANTNRLQKIENSDLRESDLEYFKTALSNRVYIGKKTYAYLGKVPSADICVQIAEFFMRIYGVAWSFVAGVHGEALVVILRNDGFRKDAGRLANEAFGPFGSAGGHRGASRAEISLDFLQEKGINPEDSTIDAFVRQRLNL
jgi:nanoRNase/pAp phosphatase (c-di-AMP/oligoRNAs hydrolase)